MVNEARIAEARARLAAHLGELQGHVTRARKLVSPRTYLASPWVKLGLGIAAGYLVGYRRPPMRLLIGTVSAPPAEAPARPGLVGQAVRATVRALAGALLEGAMTRVIRPALSARTAPRPPLK